MSLKLLNDDAILIDNLPAGNLVEFLRTHPARAADYIAALRARVEAESVAERVGLTAAITAAQAALDTLRAERDAARAERDTARAAQATAEAAAAQSGTARTEATTSAATRIAQLERRVAELVGQYEPKPYFKVHALPAAFDPKLRPQWADVTHVGVRRAPEIGGAWLVDLLREMKTDTYARVVAGVEIPADPKVSSYTELDSEFFAADLAAWFTAQNTPAEKAST